MIFLGFKMCYNYRSISGKYFDKNIKHPALVFKQSKNGKSKFYTIPLTSSYENLFVIKNDDKKPVEVWTNNIKGRIFAEVIISDGLKMEEYFWRIGEEKSDRQKNIIYKMVIKGLKEQQFFFHKNVGNLNAKKESGKSVELIKVLKKEIKKYYNKKNKKEL